MLADAAALATVLLRLQKIDTEALRDAAAASIAALRVEDQPPELIPFSGPARKALELTVREALRLGHNYVGTEHQLLALLELEAASSTPGRCTGAASTRTGSRPI
ncbi:clp amino terminal domain protein [Mycobacterium intracellulare 1956]|uniref:Clp amino terminal domain protein n=1 Tax=Mycobacterium intracellulare 1956 TaxID=1299331 RepID=X8CGB0_MYCIT|nr:clp amino terminal domain protein [Mycobacterium intracellulare 1956]